MSDIIIPNITRVVKDEEGMILIEAPLLEIFYNIGTYINQYEEDKKKGDASPDSHDLPEPELSQAESNEQKFRAVAAGLNKKYGCQLNWFAARMLTQAVETEAAELKKKGLLLEK